MNPRKGKKTASENAVMILNAYEHQGYEDAKRVIKDLNSGRKQEINRNLIAMHALVAAMQGELTRSFGIIGLLRHIKALS